MDDALPGHIDFDRLEDNGTELGCGRFLDKKERRSVLAQAPEQKLLSRWQQQRKHWKGQRDKETANAWRLIIGYSRRGEYVDEGAVHL